MVSNLPKYYTEERFKKDFGVSGVVTDARIIRLKDGTSRRFGFIGFKTDGEAKKALKHFRNTYIDTCKINVEIALKYGDDIKRKVWSKHTKAKLQESGISDRNGSLTALKRNDNTLEAQIQKKKKILQSLYELEKDPQAQEVLKVMRPSSAGPSWMDDAAYVCNEPETANHSKKKLIVTAVPNKKPGGEGLLVTKSHFKFDSDSDSDNSEEYVDIADLQNKKQEILKLEDRPCDNGEGSANSPDKNTGPHDLELNSSDDRRAAPDIILQTGRLFITNIPYSCAEEDLIEYFEKYGTVREVHIILNKKTKQSTGMAFARFLRPEHALRVFSEAQGSIFQGRVLHLSPGLDLPKPNGNSMNKTFKQKRLEERKLLSSESFNWGKLFMNPNTVADAASTKLGIGKGELLSTEAYNVAVRLALAETDVIQDVKQYLRENGVNLEALERHRGPRGGNVIVVKNIPPKVNRLELEELFSAYGAIKKLLLPPSSAIALVAYENAREAKIAFSKLAYSQFKDVPLLLEWAPKDIFVSEESGTLNATASAGECDKGDQTTTAPVCEELSSAGGEDVPEQITHEKGAADSDTAEDDDIHSTTLYVTNLNFKTTEAELKQLMDAYNGVRSVKLAMGLKKNSLSKVSMGFGFIEFESAKLAKSALASLNGTTLHGHKLLFKISNGSKRPSRCEPTEVSALETTKLVVRNVPFQASKHELRDLFKTFGELKSLRLPKKMDGQHRGFAFIEYVTKQDAKLALNSLKSSHLYGRHLVIERARDENELSSIRRKAATSLSNVPDPGHQREKKLRVAELGE